MNFPADGEPLKKVLFVITIYQFSRETFPVLEYFKKQGYQVHILIGWTGRSAIEYEELCRRHEFISHYVPRGLGYIDEEDGAPDEKDQQGASLISVKKNDGGRRVYRYLVTEIMPLISFLSYLRRFSQIKNFSRKILSLIQPEIVFGGPYQSCGYIDEGITKECQQRRLSVFCLPFSPYYGEKYAVGARFSWLEAGMLSKDTETDSSLANKLIAKAFPNWARYRNGKGLFRFHPAHMLAAWISGVFVQNPWQWPSEKYHSVFVESEFSKKLLLDSRYDPSKVVVCGKPLLDEVCRRSREKDYLDKLFTYLGVETGGAFLLINIEPSAEHNYSTWNDHWERFRGLMDCLKDIDIPIVLSLHPLCHVKKYLFAEKEYGVKICLEYKIHELYPHCYLSVSYPCSTNLMADVFNKDLIIYDFFGLTRKGAPNREYHKLPKASFAYSPKEVRERLDLHMETVPWKKTLGMVAAEGQSQACEKIFSYAEAFVVPE